MAVLKYKKQDGTYATLTNIAVKGITPVPTTGSSETDVMSQKAVTDELNLRLLITNFNTYSGAVDTAIGNKVDKVQGKGLSENDFTTTLKDKLDAIAEGAEVNVNADWNATEGDAQILNKPTTLGGYGITDANITNDTITLGNNTIKGLSAVTVGGYEGSAITTYNVSYDAYGRVSSACGTVYSAITLTASTNTAQCPSEIEGASKSGWQANVVYVHNGTTASAEYTVTIPTTYKTPDGKAATVTCKGGGYCEVNYLNIGGVIYARGV